MTIRNTHESTHNTDEMFLPVEDAPIPDGHATRFIDVHIYDVGPEQDEPPTVESEPAAPHEDEQDSPEPRRHIAVLPLVGVAVCVLLVGVLSVVFLLPLLTPPEATITLVQVQITVSETCTGTTYNTQAYQSRIMQIAAQHARDGYLPIGQVQSTITHAISQDHHRTQLHVMIAQSYAYQVSQQQQQDIKILIAGKSKALAVSTLLHIPGIQSVSVSSATIPTETQHISL